MSEQASLQSSVNGVAYKATAHVFTTRKGQSFSRESNRRPHEDAVNIKQYRCSTEPKPSVGLPDACPFGHSLIMGRKSQHTRGIVAHSGFSREAVRLTKSLELSNIYALSHIFRLDIRMTYKSLRIPKAPHPTHATFHPRIQLSSRAHV